LKSFLKKDITPSRGHIFSRPPWNILNSWDKTDSFRATRVREGVYIASVEGSGVLQILD